MEAERQHRPAAAAATAKRTASQRMDRLLEGAAQHAPASVGAAIDRARPAAKALVRAVAVAYPHAARAVAGAQRLWAQLPPHSAAMAAGLFVCLFAGHFAALVAVFEAFRVSGAWKRLGKCAANLRDAWRAFDAASKKDDAVDADGDGTADVDQITAAELFVRKATLAMRTVDPQVVHRALAGLYQGLLGAVMVVRFRFAKTVALGNSIGDFLVRSVSVVLLPVFERSLPEEYRRWAQVAVQYACKALGVSLAWTLQFYQSAVQGAITGGLTFGRALVRFLHAQGQISIDPEETFLDEIVGWAMAVVGLWIQYMLGFKVPFPLNVVFLPATIAERFLHWQASSSATTPPLFATAAAA